MTEIYKAIHNRGLPIDASFFRDSNGNEVDFVLERQRIPVPVEIKASTAFSLDFARGIRYFMGLVEEARPGWIVYGGEERFEGGDYTAIGFAEAAQVVLDR